MGFSITRMTGLLVSWLHDNLLQHVERVWVVSSSQRKLLTERHCMKNYSFSFFIPCYPFIIFHQFKCVLLYNILRITHRKQIDPFFWFSIYNVWNTASKHHRKQLPTKLFPNLRTLLGVLKEKLSHSLAECETLAVWLTAQHSLCESALTCIQNPAPVHVSLGLQWHTNIKTLITQIIKKTTVKEHCHRNMRNL